MKIARIRHIRPRCIECGRRPAVNRYYRGRRVQRCQHCLDHAVERRERAEATKRKRGG